jgi:hypothetical protein
MYKIQEMKTQISIALFLMFFSLTTSAFGQVSSDSVKKSKYIYCELTASAKAFGSSLNIKTDFGAEKDADHQIMNDPITGKPRSFTSIIDVLNFLSEKGWDVVAAYTNDTSITGFTTTLNCVYILRKFTQ